MRHLLKKIFLASSLLWTTFGQAQTGTSCPGELQQIAPQVEIQLAQALNNVPPVLTGILSMGVTFEQAKSICQKRGMRLPTIRELTIVAQSMGAKKIKETAPELRGLYARDEAVQVEISQMRETGYWPIYKLSDVNVRVIDFYYNSRDRSYNRPEGDLGNTFFWSSSIHPEDFDATSFYLFDGHNGVIHVMDGSFDYLTGVRCVRSH